MAEKCQEGKFAGKNLKLMCFKGNQGKIPEPKEPIEAGQLDFWGPIKYLQESKKYVIVAVDRFSTWSSARVCNTNRSDKILKFLKRYINNHEVPKKIHVEQGRNFMSKDVKTFCHAEALKLYSRRLMTTEPPSHRLRRENNREFEKFHSNIRTGETTGNLGENDGESTRSVEIFTERDTENNAIQSASR